MNLTFEMGNAPTFAFGFDVIETASSVMLNFRQRAVERPTESVGEAAQIRAWCNRPGQRLAWARYDACKLK